VNLPPEDFVRVSEEDELEFLSLCLQNAGMASDHAAVVSRLLTNSDLRGVRSHGIGWAPGYCRHYNEGRHNPEPDMHVVHDTASTVIVDGDGALGYVPSVMATELAIGKAKASGVSLGLVRHIGHYGAAGHYTRMCKDAGCIGFSVQGFRPGEGAPRDPKPSAGFTGAPPMSFAIPGGDEPGIVLDMVAHAMSGYNAPQFEDLLERVPAAFFKSMGLVAAAMMIGGPLTGFTLPEADDVAERWGAATLGGTILVIDVAAVVPPEEYARQVDGYVRSIRNNYAPLPGYDEVLLPGHVEERIMAQHRREGIRFGEREQQAAQQMSDEFGVSVPW
jgi:LDH2 family malate/lactate/ureidoglycolate dehydrogenase